MKRVIVPLLIVVLFCSTVLADCPCSEETETETLKMAGQGQGTGQNASQGQEQDQGNGEGQEVQTEQQTENQGEEETLMIQQREQTRARNVDELKEMIQEKKQEMNQEMESLGETQQKIYQNQNRVREAVHALLAMENLTGGIGRNVSQIAREFNNSVQATIRAEERIQTRNMLMKFFFGGNEQAADDIEQEVNRNRIKVQELKRLMQECECDEEVKAMLQEQIQNMEMEQNRLQELSQNEKQSKGIFGWLWK